MAATLFESLDTTFQRLILGMLAAPTGLWTVSDPSSMSYDLGPSSLYSLEFIGFGLSLDSSGGPLGTVTNIVIRDTASSANVVAEIALDAAISVSDLNDSSQGYVPGEPDFNDPGTVHAYELLTPSRIDGSLHDDTIEAGTDITDIFAGTGNDVVLGGPGGGNYDLGGQTFDALDFRNLTDGGGIVVDLADGSGSSATALWTISGVHHVFGTPFDDDLRGTDINDALFGRSGNDFIDGRNGDDELHGDDGNDKIFGRSGNDSLFGENDRDTLDGGGGGDTLRGGNGDDTLIGDDGDDRLYGGAQNDSLRGDDGNDLLFGKNGRDDLFGGQGDDALSGNAGFDILHGGAGADNLSGNGGADKLFGEGGRDTLFGGKGQDTLKGDGANDELHGGSQDDLIDGGAGNDTLRGDNGNDSLTAGDGDDLLFGGSGNDTLIGSAGDDTLNGGAGNDVLLGDAGNDTFKFKGADLGQDRVLFGTGDVVYLVGQTAADVTISMGGQFGTDFVIDHLSGQIVLTDLTGNFTIDDILFG